MNAAIPSDIGYEHAGRVTRPRNRDPVPGPRHQGQGFPLITQILNLASTRWFSMGLCPCYAYMPQGVPLPVSRMLILIVNYPYCGIAWTRVALCHMKLKEITENFLG